MITHRLPLNILEDSQRIVNYYPHNNIISVTEHNQDPGCLTFAFCLFVISSSSWLDGLLVMLSQPYFFFFLINTVLVFCYH